MKVHLNDMIFYGFHGVYPEERKLGQRFIVTFTFETEDENDIKIKELSDTIDYTKVYSTIKHIMENKQFLLLENCANEMIETVFNTFPGLKYINVKIKKPSVPINGTLSSVELEMSRSR